MLFKREAKREKEKQSRRSGIDRCNESCPAAWAAAFQTIGVTFARSSNRRDFLRASVTRWPYGISFCSDGSAGVRSRHELIVRNERRGRRRRGRKRGGGAGGWRESIVWRGVRERGWKGRKWKEDSGRTKEGGEERRRRRRLKRGKRQVEEESITVLSIPGAWQSSFQGSRTPLTGPNSKVVAPVSYERRPRRFHKWHNYRAVIADVTSVFIVPRHRPRF